MILYNEYYSYRVKHIYYTHTPSGIFSLMLPALLLLTTYIRFHLKQYEPVSSHNYITFELLQAPYFYPILILQQWQHIFYFR